LRTRQTIELLTIRRVFDCLAFDGAVEEIELSPKPSKAFNVKVDGRGVKILVPWAK
jgi:hypothetical protein